MAIDWEKGNDTGDDNVYAVKAFDAVEEGRSIRRHNARLTILQLGLTVLVLSMGLLVVLATMNSGPLANDNKVEAASACDLIGMSFEEAVAHADTEGIPISVMQTEGLSINVITKVESGKNVALYSLSPDDWDPVRCETITASAGRATGYAKTTTTNS